MPGWACRSGSRCTSELTKTHPTASSTWSRRFGAPSSTSSAITSGWRRTTFLTEGLFQGPEPAVPQDQWVALTRQRDLDRTDEHVVVAGLVHLDDIAFEPGDAAVDERDAVGAEVVRHLPPRRVHARCAAGEPFGEELLRARQDADVELAGLDDRGTRVAPLLPPPPHQRRI